jgi:ribosomal protein S18 acetylase RimI-like enzyme
MIKIVQLDLENAEANAEGIERLYESAGWSSVGDNPQKAAKSLKNSHCAFAAFDGTKMVGYFRALSDGVSDAYLLDLIVDPQYRRRGIAGELTARIVARLKADGIDWITAISTPEAKDVYLKIGKRMRAHTPIRFL